MWDFWTKEEKDIWATRILGTHKFHSRLLARRCGKTAQLAMECEERAIQADEDGRPADKRAWLSMAHRIRNHE